MELTGKQNRELYFQNAFLWPFPSKFILTLQIIMFYANLIHESRKDKKHLIYSEKKEIDKKLDFIY